MALTKQYPLEIIEMYELESSGPAMAYYSKGWHDLETFGVELREFFNGERGEELDLDYRLATKTYMRYVPFDGNQMQAICPAKDGPGAFPVTYLDTGWPGVRP